MKVKCIDNVDGWFNITIGKTYKIIGEDELGYKIINDLGEENWYIKEWFKQLSKLRNETINKLLE